MYLCGMIYDPKSSIQENAINNGVSIYAVRKYLQRQGIDRRFDNALMRYDAVQRLKRAKPHLTATEIATALNLSRNTAKKYMDARNKPSKSGTSKVSKIDLSSKAGVIMSVSRSQDEILSNIMLLYLHAPTFDCDLTYSKGGFYSHLQKPNARFDKNPLTEDVQPLTAAYNLPNGSFESVVVDLPYIAGKNKGLTSMIGRRFTAFDNISELFAANEEMIKLAYRLLRPNGYLIVKTMDTNYNSKQYFVSFYVQRMAEEIGLILQDIFILVARQKLLYYRGTEQHHARKAHAYFFVFQKPNK